MSYIPGDTYVGQVTTYDPGTGASADAASLPAASVHRNGTVDNSVTVTVTHMSAGLYKAVCTIPLTYAPGNAISVVVTATVTNTITSTNVTASEVIDSFVLDGARVSDILATFGLIFTVADGSPSPTGFLVTGPPADVGVNAYVGLRAGVLLGDATRNPNAVGQSAPILASSAAVPNTNPPQVRLTLGSGLSAPPDDGDKVWLL